MARYRGTIQGNRGEASRLGSKSSGMVGNVDGWNLGVQVSALPNTDDSDIMDVRVTGGSNRRGHTRTIAKVSIDSDGNRVVTLYNPTTGEFIGRYPVE